MKNGVYFTKLTLLLFIVPLVFFVLSVIFEPLKIININIFVFIGIIIDLMLFIMIFLDGFLSPDYKKKIKIEIIENKIFKINSYNNIKIKVENNNRLPVNFYYLLDLDYSFDREYSKNIINVGPLQEKVIDIKIFAKRRGEYKSELFFIKGLSLFKLLYFYNRVKHDITFEVVPFIGNVNEDFKIIQKKIKKFEGFQKNNMIGDGHDFEMLRDYVKGDEFGKIDWKATSRQRKPITRVYRLENTLEVAIMIDCSRLLSTEVKGMSLLDYAVNSALVLSYSAIHGHDRVSLTCFGADIIKYIPPIKNKKDVKKLNYVLTNVEYQHVESNYQTAFGFIKQNLPKRSMIIIMTDIIDDSNIKIYHKYLSVLKKKHIVLLVLIRDKNLFNIGESLLSGRLTVFTKAASADLILRRNKMIFDLKKLGIDILDLYPEEITAKVINKYVEIKSRN
jgi:uncharacterized protein (DUF58 family)